MSPQRQPFEVETAYGKMKVTGHAAERLDGDDPTRRFSLEEIALAVFRPDSADLSGVSDRLLQIKTLDDGRELRVVVSAGSEGVEAVVTLWDANYVSRG